jgi:hypothetical protein
MLSLGCTPLAFATLEDALKANRATGNRHIVVLSMGPHKTYGLLISKASVVKVPCNMCLAEMITKNTARPCIDFDSDIEPKIPIIEAAVCRYFVEAYGLHPTVEWKCSQSTSKTWHCMISGIYYKECWTEGCLRMIRSLGLEEADIGIYRHVSSLRMIGQCKYVDGVFCKILLPLRRCSIDDLCLSPSSNDIPMDREMATEVPRPLPVELGKFRIPKGYIVGELMYDNLTNKIYRLKRVHPSHCSLCMRLHEKENAMMILRSNSVEIRCFRNSHETMLYHT